MNSPLCLEIKSGESTVNAMEAAISLPSPPSSLLCPAAEGGLSPTVTIEAPPPFYESKVANAVLVTSPKEITSSPVPTENIKVLKINQTDN